MGDWSCRARPAPVSNGWILFVKVSSQALDSILQSDIPERTLARRKCEGVFSREESAKLLRLARVAARSAEVFEHLDLAIGWLKSPTAALGGVTPLSLIDTDIGADSVMDTLGRIEHGVFA